MPDLDERLEHLIGGLGEPVDTAGAVERVRGRVVRRQRQRRLVAGGAIVGLAAATFGIVQLAASNDHDRSRVITTTPSEHTTTTEPVTTTTEAHPASTIVPDKNEAILVKASAMWPGFVSGLPTGTVRSTVTRSPAGPVAVTGGREPMLTLYRFADDGWAEAASFDTRLPLAPDYATAAHISVVDVTGDGQGDFVVTDIIGADHAGGTVLAEVADVWHLIPFGEKGTYVTFLALEDAAARSQVGSVLTTDTNDCTPDCADGTITRDHWRYDDATGTFVSVAHEVVTF